MSWHDPHVMNSLQTIDIEATQKPLTPYQQTSNSLRVQLADLLLHLARKLDPSLNDLFAHQKIISPNQTH